MKLVKCKKCGATIMTADTMLANMQEEYEALAKKAQSKKIKGADKVVIAQQMSQLKKMMIAVVHNTSEAEIRKSEAYNELHLLKKYIIDMVMILMIIA